MAFNDTDEFSKFSVGVGYEWSDSWYSSDDTDVAEASRVYSFGYKADENTQFLLSYHGILSYFSATYKRSIHSWAFDNERFVPYFSGEIGMANDDSGDIFGISGGFGLDYRLNSYVELNAGLTLSELNTQVKEGDGSASTSHKLNGGINFGVRIYPF